MIACILFLEKKKGKHSEKQKDLEAIRKSKPKNGVSLSHVEGFTSIKSNWKNFIGRHT
jgi:LAS superfamily LD-carboxypeptidase LdcB